MPAVTVPQDLAKPIERADTVYGPGAGHLDEPNIGGNPYPYGECTYYVWQYYHDTQGVDIAPNLGNATDWVASAHREGYAVDNIAVAGKAVSWSGAKYPPFGHVAVVKNVNGDGSFDVLEMNFTYYARENANLAGKIDGRTVKNLDGVQGFITPHGVQVSNQGDSGNIMDALGLPLNSIGDAIKQAGLYVQADLMTAQHRMMSMGQVAAGLLLSGSGGALMAFTLAGRGDASAGYGVLKRRVKKATRKQSPTVSPTRTYTPTEQTWLSRAQRAAISQQQAIKPTPAPKASAPRVASEATQLRREIAQATRDRRVAGANSKGWVEATVRLNMARNRLNKLKGK